MITLVCGSCSPILSSTCFRTDAVASDAEDSNPEGLALLQIGFRYRKGAMEPVRSISQARNWPGATHGFDKHSMEKMFDKIQGWGIHKLMEDFITSVLLAAGATPPALMVHNYSRAFANSSWNTLWQELVSKNWLPDGKRATFTEPGFMAVAARKNHSEMESYIRRLIHAEGGEVLNEFGFARFAKSFRGDISNQTFRQLTHQLHDTGVSEEWVAYPPELGELPYSSFRQSQNSSANSFALAQYMSKLILCAGGLEPKKDEILFFRNELRWKCL